MIQPKTLSSIDDGNPALVQLRLSQEQMETLGEISAVVRFRVVQP